MLSIRRPKIHRRSLLAIGASFATALSIPRRSDGAETKPRAELPRNVHRDSDTNEQISANQMREIPDLKALSPDRQVASIRYSNNTYRVKTVAGTEILFQEFDLRFKTDASVHGPADGRPALLPASMRKDRAFIVFATLGEIGAFIEHGV